MRFNVDFDQAPLLVIWEVTRSCALACQHCRASAINLRDPRELTTDAGRRLLDDIREMGTPLVIFTGGDPTQRSDLEDLIRHGKQIGLRVGTIPATTDALSYERVAALKDAGLDQMAISIDGPTAEKHDAFRRVPGCFDIAMKAAQWAHDCALPLQVNTVFAAWNADDFDALAALVKSLDVVFWEVFFLVPTGRGDVLPSCTTAQYDRLFGKLHRLSQDVNFIVKVTEAQHYRVHQLLHPATRPGRPDETHAGPPLGSVHHGHGGAVKPTRQGVNSGKGFCFVDHIGDVYPSGFLPIHAGNVQDLSIIDIYRESPLFRELRDPSLLQGACGACQYRDICGGSRARAYAVTGNYLAEEPFCPYAPALAGSPTAR